MSEVSKVRGWEEKRAAQAGRASRAAACVSAAQGSGPQPQSGDTVLIDYVLRRGNG